VDEFHEEEELLNSFSRCNVIWEISVYLDALGMMVSAAARHNP
jgi:hypothetical protein